MGSGTVLHHACTCCSQGKPAPAALYLEVTDMGSGTVLHHACTCCSWGKQTTAKHHLKGWPPALNPFTILRALCPTAPELTHLISLINQLFSMWSVPLWVVRSCLESRISRANALYLSRNLDASALPTAHLALQFSVIMTGSNALKVLLQTPALWVQAFSLRTNHGQN